MKNWIRAKLRKFVGLTLLEPDRWFTLFDEGNPEASSGERVTSGTALAVSAYFGSIRAISEDVGKLPLNIYERLEPRGKQIRHRHPAQRLLHSEPNPDMSAIAFRETLTAHALGYGGGYAEIERGGDGTPTALWPLDPTSVTPVKRAESGGRSSFGVGEVTYEVRMPDGRAAVLPQRNVIHIHGLGFTGIAGYLIAHLGKESIGRALAAQKFSGSFFGNGTMSNGVLQVPESLSPQAFENLRKSFAERYSGANNAHRPVILEQGTTFNPTTTDPEKGQLVETLQFTVEDICRWFRIPPHKVQHLLHATFSNIEEQSKEYVDDTLMPWLIRWEQEIWRKLISRSQQTSLFAQHVVQALLRGNAEARSKFYNVMHTIGALSINDIRDLEDMNSIGEGGETYFVQMNMQPVEFAIKEPEPVPAPLALPDTSDEQIEDMIEAHTPLMAQAVDRILAMEQDRVRKAMVKGNGWADDFYREHESHVIVKLAPSVEAFVRSVWTVALGGEPADEIVFERVKEIAAAHVKESRLSLDRYESWRKDRPRLFAESMICGLAEWVASQGVLA